MQMHKKHFNDKAAYTQLTQTNVWLTFMGLFSLAYLILLVQFCIHIISQRLKKSHRKGFEVHVSFFRSFCLLDRSTANVLQVLFLFFFRIRLVFGEKISQNKTKLFKLKEPYLHFEWLFFKRMLVVFFLVFYDRERGALYLICLLFIVGV